MIRSEHFSDSEHLDTLHVQLKGIDADLAEDQSEARSDQYELLRLSLLDLLDVVSPRLDLDRGRDLITLILGLHERLDQSRPLTPTMAELAAFGRMCKTIELVQMDEHEDSLAS